MVVIELTEEQIKAIARAGAEVFHEKQLKQRKSDYEKKLRNTKLILDNYRFLEDNVNVGLPKLDLEDQETAALIPKWELSVYALIGYQARSKTMIKYIDSALAEYRSECLNSGNEEKRRRYLVIELLYLNKKTINRERCAERFNVNHRTIDRDVKLATYELSIVIWGADAINDLSMMS